MYELYSETILNHTKNPRNWGTLDPSDAAAEAKYSLCGDHLRLTLRLNQHQRITAIGWYGDNCAISQASASMLGERVLGKTLIEIRQIGRQDIFDMLDIPLPQNRVKCALLSLQVLTVALYGQTEWLKLESEDE
jgi:nitrogen fixation NifU-like protein